MSQLRHLHMRVVSGLVFLRRFVKRQIAGSWSFGFYLNGWPEEKQARFFSYFDTSLDFEDVVLPGGLRSRGYVRIQESVQLSKMRNLDLHWNEVDPEDRGFWEEIGYTEEKWNETRKTCRNLLEAGSDGTLTVELAVRCLRSGKFLLIDGGHRLAVMYFLGHKGPFLAKVVL
jgi:hypothetical protein